MANWTYQQLATAAALLGTITDYGAAAATLNAQTATVTQPFSWEAARVAIAQLGTGDLVRLAIRGRGTPSAIPPVTLADEACFAAIGVSLLLPADTIPAVTGAAGWTSFQASMAVLVAIGDLTSAAQAAVMALATTAQPVWQPAVQANDVWVALGQP